MNIYTTKKRCFSKKPLSELTSQISNGKLPKDKKVDPESSNHLSIMNHFYLKWFIVAFCKLLEYSKLKKTPLKIKKSHLNYLLVFNYQGKLTDPLGNPVRDSNYSVTFALFTAPSGGTPFWTETKSIWTRAGLFNTLLGEITPKLNVLSRH